MSGQRPAGLEVTSPMTLPAHPSHPQGAPSCAVRDRGATGLTGHEPLSLLTVRRPRVTMGTVTAPARRPEDAAGDADSCAASGRGTGRGRRPLSALPSPPRSLWPGGSSPDHVLAEDVLQDAFLSVWRDPAAFDASPSLPPGCWPWCTTRRWTPSDARSRQRRRKTRAEDDLPLAAPGRSPTSRTTPGPGSSPTACARARQPPRHPAGGPDPGLLRRLPSGRSRPSPTLRSGR